MHTWGRECQRGLRNGLFPPDHCHVTPQHNSQHNTQQGSKAQEQHMIHYNHKSGRTTLFNTSHAARLLPPPSAHTRIVLQELVNDSW